MQQIMTIGKALTGCMLKKELNTPNQIVLNYKQTDKLRTGSREVLNSSSLEQAMKYGTGVLSFFFYILSSSLVNIH
jgi:hypothetical protein